MTDPLVGRVLRGRYRIERKLGQGGMGIVYAAVHLELARPVALKTLIDVVDRTDVDRFRTEALAAASLAHPHIIQVTDFAAPKDDEPAFLVMELLAGRSLARLLAERARRMLPRAMAIHVVLQMLDAIGAAHAARILHRDIKPANVFVLDGADADRPWIKLLDFGIAKIMDDGSRHTTTGTMLGTPAYMAPEQLLGQRATEATDLYAIGICLYEMLAGERPFAKKTGGELTAAILKGEPAPLNVDADLAAVVARSIHRDPAKRFATAADFAAALRAAASSPSPPSSPPKRRAALFLGVAGVTAATGVLATVLATRPPSLTPPKVEDAAVEAAAVVTMTTTTMADASAPPASASASASTSTITMGGKTLSVCADGNAGMCSEALWDCECRTDEGFVVFDSADHATARYYVHTNDGSMNGKECAGFTHSSTKATPAIGHRTCIGTCSDKDILAGRRMAVPGTPCTGYLGGKPMPGKWLAVKR